MFEVVRILHSLVRWLVVIAALVAVGRAFVGWLGNRKWGGLDDRLGLIFTVSLDIQLLLGIVLYVVSPLVQGAFADMSGAMSAPTVRFFVVEHVALMFIAVVVAHIGRALAKRLPNDRAKFKRVTLFFGAAVVLILAAIPWPFLAHGRPWLRLG
jgi:hypothetical protein